MLQFCILLKYDTRNADIHILSINNPTLLLFTEEEILVNVWPAARWWRPTVLKYLAEEVNRHRACDSPSISKLWQAGIRPRPPQSLKRPNQPF